MGYFCPCPSSTMARRGKDTCQWLLLGKTELCRRSCSQKYCKDYLFLLCQGGGTLACRNCGVGVKMKLAFCGPWGTGSFPAEKWPERQRAFGKKVWRLAGMEMPGPPSAVFCKPKKWNTCTTYLDLHKSRFAFRTPCFPWHCSLWANPKRQNTSTTL